MVEAEGGQVGVDAESHSDYLHEATEQNDRADGSGSFVVEEGQLVVLVDARQRKTLARIHSGDSTHTHLGSLRHSDLIGVAYGKTVLSMKGRPYRVFPATVSDFVHGMPRSAQVIYPKDLAQMLFNLDLFPGAKVLESGVGSGALSISLLRSGAMVKAVELRDEFARVALKNVQSITPPELLGNYEIVRGDAYSDDLGSGFDRAALDLPEPWKALDGVRAAMVDNGIICCFTTNVSQLMDLHEALPRSGFTLVTTTETLEREWYINGRIVRPQHRMAGHTGFITTARVAPRRIGGEVLAETEAVPSIESI